MRAAYAWLRRDGLPGSPPLFGRLIPTGKTSDVFFALAIGHPTGAKGSFTSSASSSPVSFSFPYL
jgi:hypothetical protein